MKKIFSLLIVIMAVCSVTVMPTFAVSSIPEERQKPRLVDEADILTEQQEEDLLSKLDSISEELQCDVAVITVDSLDGKTVTAYADDYYDYNGYGMGEGDDGTLLLLSMSERKWAITTYGYAITALTDEGQRLISEEFQPYLKEGNYYRAFEIYADDCYEFITSAKNGYIIDIPEVSTDVTKGKFNWVTNGLISLVIGAVLGLGITFSMASQLKSVALQRSAVNYTKQGSLNVTQRREIYLYRTVDKEKIESSSGSSGSRRSGGSRTHRSSSGRRHGGSSGSF